MSKLTEAIKKEFSIYVGAEHFPISGLEEKVITLIQQHEITGKQLHEMRIRLIEEIKGPLARKWDWEDLDPKERKVYEAMAKEINGEGK